LQKQMDFSNATQLLNGTNYEEWNMRMQVTLKAAGFDVWKSITTGYTTPKKVKSMTQKDARKQQLNGIGDHLGRIDRFNKRKDR